MITLRDYQIVSAAQGLNCLTRHKAFLDASETGTGKTPKSVIIAKEFGRPVGIICPLSVVPVWKRWCAEGGIAPHFILNYEQLRTGKTPYGEWVQVPGRRTLLKDKTWDIQMEEKFRWNLEPEFLLIFDEVHYCKGISSQNGELLSAAKPHYVAMLSATPIESPLDCRHMGYILGLHNGKLNDFFQFAVNYGANVSHRRARDLVFRKNDEALRRLHARIFPEKGDKITVAELGDRFPSSQLIVETYDIQGIPAVYTELDKALDNLKGRTEAGSNDPLALRVRATQKAELLRIPIFVEKTVDFLKQDKSVVCFLNYRESIEQLAELLRAPVIHGDVPPADREKILEDFQENFQHVLICQSKVGGTGLSMHDLKGRPRRTLISPTDNARDFQQILGRIPRDGALSPSLQYLILAAGTVEEQIRMNIDRKLNNLSLITDEDLCP